MPDQYEQLRQLPLKVVLATLGFEDWKWRKDGSEGYGRCPVCHPKKNTTAFSFDDSGKFHCFSCGVKGRGAIDLYKAVKACGFQEAVNALAELHVTTAVRAEPQISPPQSESGGVPENPPFKGSYEKFAVQSTWLAARGLTEDTLKRYEVFQYDNPKRKSVYSGSVMLKIRRWCDGECVGYLSRNISEVTPEKPKYSFPKGLQKSLEVFGAWQLKNEATLPLRVVYLVESPFSVLKFHQLGFPALSCFGWPVSDQQLDILASLAKGCCYLPDRNVYDQAREQAGRLSRRLWCRFPELPNACDDPEHLTADQIRALTS